MCNSKKKIIFRWVSLVVGNIWWMIILCFVCIKVIIVYLYQCIQITSVQDSKDLLIESLQKELQRLQKENSDLKVENRKLKGGQVSIGVSCSLGLPTHITFILHLQFTGTILTVYKSEQCTCKDTAINAFKCENRYTQMRFKCTVDLFKIYYLHDVLVFYFWNLYFLIYLSKYIFHLIKCTCSFVSLCMYLWKQQYSLQL